jgi:hypothetical protein
VDPIRARRDYICRVSTRGAILIKASYGLCKSSGNLAIAQHGRKWRLSSAKFCLIEIMSVSFGTPITNCCGPRPGTSAMATTADYRIWAEECFEWARTAHDERVREQYANLAQIWLECAVRAELRSAVITPPEPTTARLHRSKSGYTKPFSAY